MRAIVFPLIIFLAGCLILTFTAAPAGVFIGSLLMLCGDLGAYACFGAEVRNNTPADRVGLYQGLRIFMIVLIPMLIGPWIGSTISSAGVGAVGFGVVGDGFAPSSMIFLAGALVSLLMIVMIVIIGIHRHNMSKKATRS